MRLKKDCLICKELENCKLHFEKIIQFAENARNVLMTENARQIALIDLNSISAVGNIREMPRPRGEFTLFQFSIYLKNSSIKIDISMYEHETIVETREELIQELTGEIKC